VKMGLLNQIKNKVLPVLLISAAVTIAGHKRKSNQNDVKPDSKPLVYCDFPEIDFGSLPAEKVDVPDDLTSLKRFQKNNGQEFSYYWNPRMSSPKTLEKLALAEASKLGHDLEGISTLSAKDAIMLGVEIVASRMEYAYVDEDEDFIAKHGKVLPIDKYFELGKGDCDKYSAALISVFRLIKKHNPNLRNVYMARDLGGIDPGHSWNNIIFLTKDGIILTHIDPTWYDGGDDLEAKRGVHIPEKDKELFAQFYSKVGNYQKSYDFYSQILNETENTSEKARFLLRMAYVADQLSDKPKMDNVREQYLGLGAQEGLDKILYHSWQVEKEAGNDDEAEKFKQDLIDKCPDSFWISYLD